ncbi:MAG TPA: protein archease [Planctomycetaceae bacterium]|nr:protein archease [Planctomycetaceae bacterium]
MFEVFEHTADLGIHVEAESLSELLIEAARALTSVLAANPEAIEPVTEVAVSLDAAKPEDLLIDWLSEWLYRFSAEHMLFTRFEVVEHDGRIAARAWGEAVDPARHQLDTEVKAVTYHRLRVEQTEAGWTAEVILDL